jgi:lysophospholipase L1-like esterase
MEPLHPKAWLILIGSSDLFTSKCTDRFVVADILNVLKYLHMHRPEAQFIVHGLLPRKDPGSLPQTQEFLGKYWKRAQTINAQIKRFCEVSENLHYMQAGSVFTKDTEMRGRKSIAEGMMEDGVHPTAAGLDLWGDFIVQTLNATIGMGDEKN